MKYIHSRYVLIFSCWFPSFSFCTSSCNSFAIRLVVLYKSPYLLNTCINSYVSHGYSHFLIVSCCMINVVSIRNFFFPVNLLSPYIIYHVYILLYLINYYDWSLPPGSYLSSYLFQLFFGTIWYLYSELGLAISVWYLLFLLTFYGTLTCIPLN